MRSLLSRRPRQLEADLQRRADRILLDRLPKGAVVPDSQPDAVDVIELQPGADPIEGRIDGFRQVQCRIAGQILGGGETPLDFPLLGGELDAGLSADAGTGDGADRDVDPDLQRRRRGIANRAASVSRITFRNLPIALLAIRSI